MASQIDDDEPQAVPLTATCRTPDCLVEGEPFHGDYYPNAEAPIYRGLCMRCGQPIEDLVPYEAPAV
ncbi:hypothetical protein ACW4TU_41060 [Streptomyces sp. QTS52]